MTTIWFKSAAKLAGLCLCALILLMPAGCSTPSLNAAYTQESLEWIPGIEGEWIQVPKEGEQAEFALTITQGERTRYNVDLKFLKPKDGGDPSGSNTQHLVVGMTKINGVLFADATANFDAEPMFKQYADYYVPAHVFAKVSFDGNTLAVNTLNGGGMAKLLKDKPDAIENTQADSKLVVTAQTAAIRAFLGAQHANESLFVGDVIRFARPTTSK